MRGDHAEQVWINRSEIELVSRDATLTPPEEPVVNPCTGGDENGPIPDRATLICVHPLPFEDFPPPPEVYLNDMSISGFGLVDSGFDAIGVYFTNHIHIKRNTARQPGM